LALAEDRQYGKDDDHVRQGHEHVDNNADAPVDPPAQVPGEDAQCHAADSEDDYCQNYAGQGRLAAVQQPAEDVPAQGVRAQPVLGGWAGQGSGKVLFEWIIRGEDVGAGDGQAHQEDERQRECRREIAPQVQEP
jgi:hypothetical protein